jgi:hypothetical protein
MSVIIGAKDTTFLAEPSIKSNVDAVVIFKEAKLPKIPQVV